MNQGMRLASELIKIAKAILAYNEFDEKFMDAEKSGKKYILYNKEGNLWRIVAVKDFDNVHAGDMGGLVESEKNLSQNGYCWVKDEAKVYGNATVDDFAVVGEHAKVYGNAEVFGDATVYGNAEIYDDATVQEKSGVDGYAKVHGDAHVGGTAQVHDNADIAGDAQIYGNSTISGNVVINGDDISVKDALVSGDFTIDGEHDITSDITSINDLKAVDMLPRAASIAKVARELISIARMIVR